MPADAAAPAVEPAIEPAPGTEVGATVAPRERGWREQSFGTAVVMAIASVWLIVSPEALGYGPGDASWNPVVCGVLVLVFSIARALGSWRTLALGVVTFVIGAWLVVSAFLLDAPIQGQWNQASFGGIIAVLSLVGMAGAQRGRELYPE
jgi:hypothetical protein